MYTKEYFFEKLMENELIHYGEEMADEFEILFNISHVLNAVSILFEEVKGFIVLERGITYQLLFVDMLGGESSLLAGHLTKEEALQKFSDLELLI